MPVESRALFKAMLKLFEVLMAVFMEKRTAKDSSNSSKPFSQTPKDEIWPRHPSLEHLDVRRPFSQAQR